MSLPRKIMPRAICWAAVFAFLFSLVPMESLHTEEAGEGGEAEVGSPHTGDCPDGLPEGIPCSNSCACLCCPGHVRSLPAGEVMLSRSALAPVGELHERLGAIHLKEIVFSFFRPPRAA
jgi:hypothetical protein